VSGLTHFERTTYKGRKQMAAKRKLNCLCFAVFIHKRWQRILSYFYAIDVFFSVSCLVQVPDECKYINSF
jgi:hypothetical protein